MKSEAKDEKQFLSKTAIYWWIAVCLLSIAWYPLTGIYLPPNIHFVSPLWFSFAAMSIAVVCGALSNIIIKIQSKSFSALILLLSAILFSILIPFPYNIPGLFLIAAILINIFNETFLLIKLSKILNSISSSLFICGLILLLQTVLLPFFFLFASRFQQVDLLAPGLSFILNLLGSDVSYSNGNIFIHYADKVYSFIPSWELLGIYSALNVLIGGCVILFFTTKRSIKYFILALVLFVYMIFHYTVVTLAYIEVQRASVFWRLGLQTILLIPLPWLLMKFVNGNHQVSAFSIRINNYNKKRNIGFIISFSVLLISTIAFFGFSDPGEKKEGRILIDEGHSNWEWTMDKFDTTWYGEKSTYNYWSLAEYLNNFFTVDKKREELTDKLLNNYDILFIKTPTNPFTEQEVASIKRFVERGGGLLLVGDHTNVFGITSNLNPIASEFGIRFNYDGQYDLMGELSLYNKPVILPHPVVQNIPKFMFATGCTLDAPLNAENVILGYGIKSMYADYSRPNFFPKDAGNSEKNDFGIFVQAAGICFGKGRVFLFTDSTVWSNFYMFIPGKPELILGIIDWLNRRNSVFNILRLTFLFVAFGALIGSIIFAGKIGKANLLIYSLITGLIASPVAIKSFEQVNHSFYSVPKAHEKYIKVNFESEHSDIELPVLHMTQQAEKSYLTFFVWLQRLNLVPSLNPSFVNALADANAVIIINPVKRFNAEEISEARKFVESGGKLLLMDDPLKKDHAIANEFLSMLGAPLFIKNYMPFPVIIYKGNEDSLTIETNLAGRVEGGSSLMLAKIRQPQKMIIPQSSKNGKSYFAGKNPQLIKTEPSKLKMIRQKFAGKPGNDIKNNPDNNRNNVFPIMASYKLGKGSIIVTAASNIFTDQVMGYTAVIPNINQERIYKTEYWMIRDVLELRK